MSRKATSKPPSRRAQPYTALAAGYDVVMAHVDYEGWAAYIHELVARYHSRARSILELGCGTGSRALFLQPMGNYQYAAMDMSPAMLQVAREKARISGIPILFLQGDFTRFRVERQVDAILLLYDGMNYLLELEKVRHLMACVSEALAKGGLFIFDVSTPLNSINNAAYFEDENQVDEFSFVRTSRYDPESKIHTTDFELSIQNHSYRESHIQRAYTGGQLEPLIQETKLETLAVLEDFTYSPATEAAERLHWVARKK